MKYIDVETLHDWLANPAMARLLLLVDVREASECKTGMIKQAIHIPLSQLSLTSLPITGQKHIIFQCRSGMRSVTACTTVAGKLPAGIETYSLNGGIGAWAAAGYPVVLHS